MTVIVGWIPSEYVGDKYLPTSAYIASDSRVTHGYYKPIDFAQKVFYSRNTPSILGFCGDVVAGTMLIAHIIMALDQGWIKCESVEEVFSKVFEIINQDGILDRPVTILHIARKGRTKYGACLYDLRDGRWTMNPNYVTPTSFSPQLFVVGSGREEFLGKMYEFSKGNSSNTSRNVFQALCSMIHSVNTPSCGGPIQLVGLYRQGNGIPFGYTHDGAVWVLGKKEPMGFVPTNLELRNDLFERCDPKTLTLIAGAQAQPNELM